MSRKKTYIYRLSVGYYGKPPQFIEFFYATNAKKLIQYAQQMWREHKFNYFKPVKVGLSNKIEEIRMISDFESWQLKQTMTEDKYSERIDSK